MSKENQYYTYVYYDPSREMEPIYVGKGKGRRAAKHLKRNDIHPFTQRLQKMEKLGIKPVIEFILRDVSEQTAFDKEIELIALYGRKDLGKGTLLNLNDGGNAPGAWNKGKKMTLHHKNNHIKALESKGLNSWAEGCTWTQKSRDQQSQTIKKTYRDGRVLSPSCFVKGHTSWNKGKENTWMKNIARPPEVLLKMKQAEYTCLSCRKEYKHTKHFLACKGK